MLRCPGTPPHGDGRQRGAAAVEFALIVPLLLSLVFGVIDYGAAFAQTINLQGAAREAARQGVTQGDVIASASRARGLLDNSKLQVKFAVDTSAGNPGALVVCLRYPQSSLSGFFAWALAGTFEAKAVMRMEGTAPSASGSQHWNGGSCSA
ncbi:TadE/TadG family type IV pilus assembly protein [Arthrobacter sp. H16F315]|uniref:TadE/TadG family type IV pilus assembly protein n=1 Tax=Arthrobacter sp. H16F315 TaxID=2955314 RepID=UPI00209856AA|nr:TadE/TadG family type IV pilus assembly protein [Arthrobacter sp. H16F315]MDD1476829.1 TadE/TadG family type IV pilus assembly protein [Arthrobacter sp. H16F315]